jgi:hypothetical protein
MSLVARGRSGDASPPASRLLFFLSLSLSLAFLFLSSSSPSYSSRLSFSRPLAVEKLVFLLRCGEEEKRESMKGEKDRERKRAAPPPPPTTTAMMPPPFFRSRPSSTSTSTSTSTLMTFFPAPTTTKQTISAAAEVARAPKWLQDIPEATTYYPTAEEFAHPVEYIEKIMAKASLQGAFFFPSLF